jgi:small subunit ribosomal protein S22
MNLIYFPREGKEFKIPKMFSDPEIFTNILQRATEQDNTYEFILDRACLQFEPDDPNFISICEKTYQMIDSKYQHDLLKSTRHYGPMVFYLVRVRQMDNLLIHSIKNAR